MTIRNLPLFHKTKAVSLHVTKGLVTSKPKCYASDIDGVIEIDGRFLWLEGKTLGAPLSGGQSRMLNSLAGLGHYVFLFQHRDVGDKDFIDLDKDIVSYRVGFLDEGQVWWTRWIVNNVWRSMSAQIGRWGDTPLDFHAWCMKNKSEEWTW